MDEWLRQLQNNLDEAAQESGQWLVEIVEETDQAIAHAADNVAEAISPVVIEIHQQVEESIDATELFIYQRLTPWIEEVTAPITNTITPYLQEHHPCIGCKYYNGSTHGGNMLVCGMHPYGPEDKTCQDWASVWSSKVND
ncbi:MAG: hypothetical protein AB8B99_19760 [Phormidesmis sp.]